VTRRFYVGAPIPDRVEFERALVHRLANVLRLRPGDEVTLFDGSGADAVVRIDALSNRLAAP
jgi:16S rRNA U1498 N3-methylase RsmE